MGREQPDGHSMEWRHVLSAGEHGWRLQFFPSIYCTSDGMSESKQGTRGFVVAAQTQRQKHPGFHRWNLPYTVISRCSFFQSLWRGCHTVLNNYRLVWIDMVRLVQSKQLVTSVYWWWWQLQANDRNQRMTWVHQDSLCPFVAVRRFWTWLETSIRKPSP